MITITSRILQMVILTRLLIIRDNHLHRLAQAIFPFFLLRRFYTPMPPLLPLICQAKTLYLKLDSSSPSWKRRRKHRGTRLCHPHHHHHCHLPLPMVFLIQAIFQPLRIIITTTISIRLLSRYHHHRLLPLRRPLSSIITILVAMPYITSSPIPRLNVLPLLFTTIRS